MSERIADARKAIGMSQKSLAKELGIAANTLSGYENGNHKPDSDILAAVSSITGCTVDYLMNRVGGFDEYYDLKKSPAPAEAEAQKPSKEELIAALMLLHVIQSPAETLSDADMQFLTNIVALLNDWFSRRRTAAKSPQSGDALSDAPNTRENQ